MKKYTITEEDYHFMWDKIHSLENENSRLKGYIEGLKEQLRTLDVVGRSGQLNKRPNTSSTLECFTKSEKQKKFTIMELTLNELKILRNALNAKLRTVHLKSPEFDDIKQSFNKVNAEIERIENDIKQKARDEAFKAINEIENAMIRWQLARSNDDETLEEINKILVGIGRLGWFNRNKKTQ